MSTGDRLFDVDEEYPEVPILRPPARRRSEGDARFRGEYPPDWKTCQACLGVGIVPADGEHLVAVKADLSGYFRNAEGYICGVCKGMGSVKARVRFEAGHRCLRCLHPYVPKHDAERLGAEPSWREDGWSACDGRCDHGAPVRFSSDGVWVEIDAVAHREDGRAWTSLDYQQTYGDSVVEAAWRVLTVHHADGDKANVRWWNLLALCQRCHLEVQGKIVMERVYPHPHSPWFRPFVAGYYAWAYLGLELTREEAEARLEELLALELDPAYA